jgi:hypothetical protein
MTEKLLDKEDWTIQDLKNLIKKQKIYLVSHGGVGSNSVRLFLRRNLLISPNVTYLYDHLTAHYPYKLVEDIPTIYIYGDLVNSLISQYNREILHINANKIHYRRDHQHYPVGIKKQFLNILSLKINYIKKLSSLVFKRR